MRPAFDLRLYLVTDSRLPEDTLLERVGAAAAAGITLVQLRDKTAGTAQLIGLARRLVAALAPRGIPLIVNDDIEAALASSAAGVHLGQGDALPAEARARLGRRAIIGLSLERVEQIDAVDPAIVDYVAASPVFSTTTKADIAPPLGLEGVAAIRRRTALPLVGIGGVDAANAAAVIAAGADGVAVVSAILSATDAAAATAALRAAVQITPPSRNPASSASSRPSLSRRTSSVPSPRSGGAAS
jgi:thiamine-phosphate pyrophosphorylase